MGSICESLKLLFDVRDLKLPALQDPVENTYRRWIVRIQRKVTDQTFMLKALVGLYRLRAMPSSWCTCKIIKDRGVFVCNAMALKSVTYFSAMSSRPFLR